MAGISLGIVTVNWNRAEDTIACLNSLKSQTPESTHYYIVDNGSKADQIELIKSTLDNANIIQNFENKGFAFAFNQGIAEASKQGCEYVLILNNDTVADETMVYKLLEEVKRNPQVGVVAPIIFYFDHPNLIWSSGGYINPILLTPINAHNRNQKLQHSVTRTFVSGCCFLARTEVLTALRGFDQRFFVYYEDLDFFLRLMNTNWKVKVVPEARLFHKVSLSSGGSNSPRERYSMGYASVIYFNKHISWLNAIPIALFRIINYLVTVARLIHMGRMESILAYSRGIIDGIKVTKGKPS
jgi:GT2 family glycosyltransferase